MSHETYSSPHLFARQRLWPIRLRGLFADVFGNDVLSQLSLRLRMLRERDDEGRAEIALAVLIARHAAHSR